MNAVTRFDPAQNASAPTGAPIHDVYALTQGGHLAQILLDGKTYQLRITRAGKLILTK
jgi:hemin uptake protein HemP